MTCKGQYMIQFWSNNHGKNTLHMMVFLISEQELDKQKLTVAVVSNLFNVLNV